MVGWIGIRIACSLGKPRYDEFEREFPSEVCITVHNSGMCSLETDGTMSSHQVVEEEGKVGESEMRREEKMLLAAVCAL